MQSRLDPGYVARADQTLAAIDDAVAALQGEMKSLDRHGEFSDWYYSHRSWSLYVPEWLLWRWWLIRNEGGRADPGLAHWHRRWQEWAAEPDDHAGSRTVQKTPLS